MGQGAGRRGELGGSACGLLLRADDHAGDRVLVVSDTLKDPRWAANPLPNRTFLEDALALALSQRRRSGRELGLLLCDLDGFKAINDRFGHQAGDRVLQLVAERLTATARDSDLVARLAGDEFVIVCPELSAETGLTQIAQRVAHAVSRPIELATPSR